MMKLIRTVATRRGRLRTDQHGMILVVTLLMVTMLGMLGSAFLTTSGTEHQIAKNDQELIQALYVAEGGLQAALNSLNLGLTPPTTGTIGPGQFTVTVTDTPPPTGQKRLVATGYVPSQASPRALKQIAMLIMQASPFSRAVFARDQITISSSGGTDSYDSAIGLYGGSNVGSNGDIGTNGNISFAGSSLVKGNAATTPGHSLPDQSHVTGSVSNTAAPWNPPNVACPSGGYTPSVPSGSGISYDPSKGDLTVSGGGANLILSSPGTYYFHTLKVQGGATLTIASGGDANIYISSTLDASGGSLINSTLSPTSLTFWGCGTDTSSWKISGGGTETSLSIYAPNHPFTLSGGQDMYGSLVVGSFTNTGGSKLHYDEALARGGGFSGKFSIASGSWTELSL